MRTTIEHRDYLKKKWDEFHDRPDRRRH
jgi:hypothetical protein